MLIKSNTQDWHCRMVVNILWKNYLKRCLDGELNTIHELDQNVSRCEGAGEQTTLGFDYNSEQKYHVNKTPESSQTVKFENRRKLHMNSDL